MSCYVIAEAGVNHNGSLELARELVDSAAETGVDAVKFQTFRADALVRPGTPTAAYQADATGEGDQAAMLRNLEMPEAWYAELRDRAATVGIDFLSTPFDEASAAFLVDLGVERLKIGSGELTNLPFLKAVAGLGVPLIVSTGMAYLEEVRGAVDAVRAGRAGADDDLVLLHCTSLYPADPAEANLRAMDTLRGELYLPVGYSDHTPGLAVPVAAVALGAVVLEKHFTVDRSLPGPDHEASLNPGELRRLVAMVRDVERALGDGEKRPRADEMQMRKLVRRSVGLRRAVAAGHRLTEDDLIILRPADGAPPGDFHALVGRVVRQSMPAGAALRWEDVRAE